MQKYVELAQNLFVEYIIVVLVLIEYSIIDLKNVCLRRGLVVYEEFLYNILNVDLV